MTDIHKLYHLWNTVTQLLAELYELYCAESTNNEKVVDKTVLEALKRLMQAYDEWLD